jgi:uncharacterized protein YgbK (DUF1537 family)
MTRPVYGWFADDFTGATDTLATLVEGGLNALLFLRVPSAAQRAAAGPLDAVGLAGATRSLSPEAMTPVLEEAGRFFAQEGVRLLHYKCCSTFDSAPHVGSIGAAVRALRPFAAQWPVPIVGGQPNLGRFCLFGHLFAASGQDSAVVRIDRHPTMGCHPVTPMNESDLRVHLHDQGLVDMAHVPYPALSSDLLSLWSELRQSSPQGTVLLDVSREEDLGPIGTLLNGLTNAGPLLAVGSSAVARAFLTGQTGSRSAASPPKSLSQAPVLTLVGSLSPVTREQVEVARSVYTMVEIDPLRLDEDSERREGLLRSTAAHLAVGPTLVVSTRAQASERKDAALAAKAMAGFLSDLLKRKRPGRLIVGGGDTSSLSLKALDAYALRFVRPFVGGAPLCAILSDKPELDGLEVVLKGGQMGPPDTFVRALTPP